MATIPNLETESTLTFSAALERAEVLARTSLPPEAHGRIEMGMALVREGNVLQLDSGEWEVTSQTTPGTVYHVNGSCSCDDAYYRGGMCKHRLSVYLTRKAMQLMATPVETLAAQEPPVPETPAEPVQSIDPKFLTFLHGKPFVKYAGLLTMATARGLVSLDAAFISVSADLALAKATATFQDGRNFTEAADATPSNVPPHIKPHYPRMALTRAKARCLRDALNISMTALEEVEGE